MTDETKPGLRCAICIATHNRREDLENTLAVLARLDPQPAEVLITADGCSDGTVEWVRAHYPQHRLTVNEQARGSTGSRDAMFRAATSDIVLILDDDSHPIETDFLARLPLLFEAHPRAAVLNFPQRSDEFPESLQATDFGPSYFAGTYVNCASAIRRSVFLELGGYPAEFRIAYDEPDFALRCVSAGWQVRYETGLTIRHHYSGVMRNEMRMHHTHARNELWSVLLRCPAPQLLPVALFRIARQFGYAWQRGWSWVVQEPKWWLAALRGIPGCFRNRRAVPWRRYRAWMELVRRPIYDEAEWNARFQEDPR
jgi:GT2 family glycosyltransferase